MNDQSDVCILGVFVADTAFLSKRMPNVAETLAASGFNLGPGGKGSNQAVAAAKAGAKVSFISKLGRDAFADMALEVYKKSGVTPIITQMDDQPTGAAFIYVNEDTGDNAVLIYPGAAATISIDDVEAARENIERAKIFVTQLEQPVEAAQRGLEIAKSAGVLTVFNPAPAEDFPDNMYALCDFFVPNEIEASMIAGFDIKTVDDAKRAGGIFLEKGVKAAVITLGSQGVVYHSKEESFHIPAIKVEKVIDTTGAGDAFLGGFSSAIARGLAPRDAVQFGCVTAGIAVTRQGTAPAMPYLHEIEAKLFEIGV